MRILGGGESWQVVPSTGGSPVCLKELAFRAGYRLDQLCAELGCSERYLYQVFVRDLGVPPKRWMRAERMDVVRRLIAAGRTLEEVTAAAGFSSKYALRREFRAYFGEVPGTPAS